MSYYNHLGWGTVLFGCLGVIAVWVIVLFVGTFIAQYIWTSVIVAKFAAPELTYWEMFLLMVLARLIIPYNINVNNKSS